MGNDVTTQMSNDDSSAENETQEERYWRYVNSSYSDVSEPDVWMEVHSEETVEQRYLRYLTAEREEVSDTEYWDYQYETIMRENEAIARGELPAEESAPARIRALLAGGSEAAGSSTDRPVQNETSTHEEPEDE